MRQALANVVIFGALTAACGPSVTEDGNGGGDDEGGGADAGECASAEICTNGIDDDCNGAPDCYDPACAGSDVCTDDPGGGGGGNCGTLDQVTGSLALPDGEGNAYTDVLTFTGFSDGQQLEDVGDLLGICVNMEHSWLRDLQIEITCPSGTNTVLQLFLGQTGSAVFMGIPNQSDDPNLPGTGWDYCWTASAANPPMLTYANQSMPGGTGTLPAGDYQSVDPMTELVGCTLNGDWELKVEDLWGADNGFIFEWSLHFDPSIVEDCDNWPE